MTASTSMVLAEREAGSAIWNDPKPGRHAPRQSRACLPTMFANFSLLCRQQVLRVATCAQMSSTAAQTKSC